MCTRTYRDKVVKGGRMSLSKSGRGAKTIGGVGQRGMAPGAAGTALQYGDASDASYGGPLPNSYFWYGVQMILHPA